jgi:4-amino-4-deoxy-L-arabinose transferase-like glycosyltransferase
LRSVTVALWAIVALGIVDLFKRIAPAQQEAAYWTGALFLTLPFTWALNVVTTDTPLILFLFISGYCFMRGVLSGRTLWHVASGAFLGLALLSKYFAGLLAIAYFVYFAFFVRSRRGWLQLLLIAVSTLPFVAINLAFNAANCWTNVMFNLINRNEDAHWSLVTVAEYLVMMIYLITPWVFFRVARARRLMSTHRFVTLLFLVPLSIFLLLSGVKTIGLHWVLGFIPFVFLFAGAIASPAELRRYLKWTAWFSVPHFLVLAAIIVLPMSVWKGTSFYDDVVFHKETKAVVAALRSGLPAGSAIMAQAYTPASLLSYHAGEYWAVFGEGKYHARQDDLSVDFRKHAGLPIRIFDRKPIREADLAPYFDSLTMGSFDIAGVKFFYADGKNFNYALYRERILKKIADRYYRIPSYLPRYGCPFLERYEFT